MQDLANDTIEPEETNKINLGLKDVFEDAKRYQRPILQ